MTGQLAMPLHDRIITTVRCPRCRDTHTVGLPPTPGPHIAWCPRSARQYAIDQHSDYCRHHTPRDDQRQDAA